MTTAPAHALREGTVVSPYAGLVTRAIAFALDALLINMVAVVVGGGIALILSILPDSADRDKLLLVVGGTAFALWIVGYFVGFWTATGQTPGNRTMGIVVVRADGSRLRPRHCLARLVGIVLSLPLFAGFIPILVTERRRGLHDWLAGTVVRAADDAAGHDHP